MSIGNVLSVLLLLSSSCFFSGSLSAAETGTLTVRFGHTTEDTFKARHPDAINRGFNENLKGTIYQISYQVSPDSFHFDGMKNAFILFGQNKNLMAIHIQFDGDYSGIVGAFLAKKYTAVINKKPLIGTRYMELYNKGVSIYMRTRLFSNTSVFYITIDEKNKILENTPTNSISDENELLDFLIEQCFPKL
ncbi:hypothetical protein [Budvicia aquatica]|uniref:hypothetical protein n=1 Tax=Budvicia aquatica TaxID=82979 RepID=UPI00208672C5|nr:hypothetical protein [Budvicia aquatica]GKX53102.1 hypothetical protein SOASR029_34110 [Budvicia aquatica]